MHRLIHIGRHGLVARFLPVAVVLGLVCSPSVAADEVVTEIAGKTLAILRDKENVVVKQGDRVLIRYHYANVPKKPYVAEMTSPGGVNVLRDAPADHLHHHGLMFAWSVDGVNFWEESSAQAGSQVHRQWKDLRIDSSGGTERAVLCEQLDWKTADGKLLLAEDRMLVVPAAAKDQPRMLTWRADFTPGTDAAETLTIAGAEYVGLGARFMKQMDSNGLHFNSGGGKKVAGTNGKKADWSAYAAQIAPGRYVTLAMFNAPANPRHPSEFFTMGEQPPFAYLSNTLGVGTEPLKLAPGKTLSVRFGVAVFEGLVDATGVNAAYQKW